jgi:hypothetical protein
MIGLNPAVTCGKGRGRHWKRGMEGRGEEKEIKDNILYWDCLRQQGEI